MLAVLLFNIYTHVAHAARKEKKLLQLNCKRLRDPPLVLVLLYILVNISLIIVTAAEWARTTSLGIFRFAPLVRISEVIYN